MRNEPDHNYYKDDCEIGHSWPGHARIAKSNVLNSAHSKRVVPWLKIYIKYINKCRNISYLIFCLVYLQVLQRNVPNKLEYVC